MYNETDGKAIYPTPMIGMVGLIEDLKYITTQDFKQAGDAVYLIGDTGDDFSGSELQKLLGQTTPSGTISFDLDTENANQQLVKQAIRDGLLQSAHDLSEGGLGVALAEALFDRQLGFKGTTKLTNRQLFAETQSRFLVSVSAEKQAAFETLAGDKAVQLGTTTADAAVALTTADGELNADSNELNELYGGALACLLKSKD